MKDFAHPEFFLLHKVQQLREQYADIPEIAVLVADTKKIINQNSIAVAQNAMLYTMLGDTDDLYPQTKEKLKEMFENAAAHLGGGKDESSQAPNSE